MKNRIIPLSICFFLFLLASFGAIPNKKQYSLAEIIEIGLKNNPQILAKEQEVKAKKASYQSSKLFLNPELEYEKGQGEDRDTKQKFNTGGISVEQSLENPIKRKHRIRMFEKDWQASQYAFNFSKLKVVYELKNLFFSILLQKNLEKLAAKNSDSIKKIHNLIETRVKLGEIKELEAIKLKVESLQAQNELKRIKTELRLAKDNLNKFLGNFFPSDFSVQGKLEYKKLTIDEKSLVDKVLAVHPLLKKKQKEVELSESHLNYIKWQRIPDPKLKAFIQNEIDGQNKGFGISMEIPLWNFKSKEIAEAESLLLKENQELKALRIGLTTEVKSKFKQSKLTEQKIELFYSGLLAQAEESLKISEISYEQGEISLIDYFDSQRTYNEVIKDYYQALYEWNSNKASLEKSIGVEIKLKNIYYLS